MKKFLILLVLLGLWLPAAAETDSLQQAYEAALQLEAEGDVGSAADAFLSLGDYKDSVHHYKKNRSETIWIELMDLARAGDFSAARQMAEPFYDYFDESMQATCDEWVFRAADKLGPFNEEGSALFRMDDGRLGIVSIWFQQLKALSPQALPDSALPLMQNGLIAEIDPESGLFGYLDIWGQWAIQPQFNEVSAFHQDQALVKKGGAYFVIDIQGKLLSALPKGREYLQALGEGLISFTEKGLIGAADLKGRVVIKAKYASIAPFNYGYAPAMLPKKKATVAALLNLKGKEVIKAGKYAQMKVLTSDYILAAKEADGLPGVISLKGKSKLPLGSLTWRTRREGDLIITQNTDLQMGLMDQNLKQLLPSQYADIQVGGSSQIVALNDGSGYRLYRLDDLSTPLIPDVFSEVSLDPATPFLTLRNSSLGWHVRYADGSLIF